MTNWDRRRFTIVTASLRLASVRSLSRSCRYSNTLPFGVDLYLFFYEAEEPALVLLKPLCWTHDYIFITDYDYYIIILHFICYTRLKLTYVLSSSTRLTLTLDSTCHPFRTRSYTNYVFAEFYCHWLCIFRRSPLISPYSAIETHDVVTYRYTIKLI